ncbi:MAG TPA: ribosome maturation factor RimM [Steroidobacteraceae bacterium]|nr:ribosome maturation factor RimM [Steroidobacteraceae bacterium]
MRLAVVWIELGRLGSPYGIKGWIHVESHTDPPERLLQYREWVLRLGNGQRITRRVAEGRAHTAGLVARLEGVAGRNDAAALTGAVVEVDRAALPPPGERQYYRADLVGFRVRNQEGSDLGTVSHFVDGPGGVVMVSRTEDGAEHWVLADPKHLRSVDLTTREIVVDWPAELQEKAR